MPEIDGIAADKAYNETVGFDESGELVFVRQEKFEDKMKAEKAAEKSMRRLQKVISNNKNDCELRMRKARVEKGLPAERTKAIIRYEGGQAVIVRPAEQSLDDAFRFANEANEK
jgi:5'-3' exonuclease